MTDKLKQLLIRAGWAPISVVLLHAGVVGFTGHERSLDFLIHFLGGAAIAYFLSHALAIWKSTFENLGFFARSLTVFCFTCTVALFWEFAEFLSGSLTGIYTQLSLEETMGDLFMGCLGAGAFITFDLIRHRIKGETYS